MGFKIFPKAFPVIQEYLRANLYIPGCIDINPSESSGRTYVCLIARGEFCIDLAAGSFAIIHMMPDFKMLRVGHIQI